MYFHQGRLTLVELCIGLWKGTVLRPRLLGRALIWPGHFGATTFGHFGLYPSSLSKSAGFVSLPGKVSLVSISYAKSYFYTILACLFTVEVWISWIRCVGKGAIARMWRPRCHLVSPTLCISIYILSDLYNLSNLIGSLSRTIQQYSPPSEWIMCDLIVFPIFLSKVDKILGFTFFKEEKTWKNSKRRFSIYCSWVLCSMDCLQLPFIRFA